MTSGPLLRTENLRFAYPDQPDVLRGIDLRLGAEERVGVVGSNGAGKSSLFLSLCGVLIPSSGRIFWRGQPWRPGAINAGIALVFQQAEDQLFCPTVREDVGFGARNMGVCGPALDAAVGRALEAVGITELADRPVHHLSGGEKRLACIAGALVMQPRLFLHDEPSAGLDIRNRRRVIELLQSAPGAVMVASHDLELVLEVCDRVILLDGGRVVADGPARDVLGDNALMTAHGQEVPHSLTPHFGVGHSHRDRAPRRFTSE